MLDAGEPVVTKLPNGCSMTAQCLPGNASGTSMVASIAAGYLHILEGTAMAYKHAKGTPLIAGQGLVVGEHEEVQLINVGEGPMRFISLAQ